MVSATSNARNDSQLKASLGRVIFKVRKENGVITKRQDAKQNWTPQTRTDAALGVWVESLVQRRALA